MACSPTVEQKATPALWVVRDADTTLYMLGTMHALPAGTDWDDGAVGKAIAASDELVMELAPDQLAQASAEFQRLAPRDTLLPMEQRLSGKALANYRALEAGGALNGDRLDDWAVTIMMGLRAAEQAALTSGNGVEAGLTAQFRRADKPITGLETAREQMLLFETLAPQAQRALLTLSASQADEAVGAIKTLTAAWSRGDVETQAALINEDVDAIPSVKQSIIIDRNRRWAAWARQRLDRPGTVLVAVGAGHLVGGDGLPALLEAEGLRVTRVQ